MKILKHNQVIIAGLRDCTNGMWNIPLGPCPPSQKSPKRSHPNQSNGILLQDITKRELDQYFHNTAFIPVKSVFVAAINNVHFTSLPGMSVSLISKHLTQSPFVVKGRLDQEQKNLRSTQSHQDLRDDIHPKQEQHSHNILAAIINTNYKTSKSYSDQTGRFPVLSSCGN